MTQSTAGTAPVDAFTKPDKLSDCSIGEEKAHRRTLDRLVVQSLLISEH